MKFFTINKNQSAVLVTLMILIFLGAGYFFIYMPQNERRIHEQRFSALQNVDRNIHTKIENSISLLNNLLTEYQDQNEAGRAGLINYINEYASTNFRLTVPSGTSVLKSVLLKDSLYRDSAYTLKVNNDTREINLLLSKQRDMKKDSVKVYTIGMKFSFKQFIQFLLPKDIFDDYIVFSKGKSVYESFPAGISYVNQDSLLGVKNGLGSSVIRSQVISGIDYKMFLQPVGFDANNEWVIAGLLSNKHYQNEKTQLPTQLMLLLATIMLIGMVAFPWLKLYQMGSKDRLTAFDGIATIFISMILVSLVFFVFFNYNQSFRPFAKNKSGNNLANQIQQAFKNEIDTVYHKLKQLDELAAQGDAVYDIVNLDKKSIAVSSGNIEPGKLSAINSIVSGINVNQLFWLDKNGDEKINWTSDKMNAPHGNYKSRAYFKKIEENVAYRLNQNDSNAYFLEQVVSWTSGTFRSVITKRSKRSTPDSLVVAALSCNLQSLANVVLPAGFLYAITDNAGNVLYHSNPSRNLNENLLHVFSQSNQLRSCLYANAEGSFDTKYYGNNYQVKVKPVNGLPYFIVIFEDAGFIETMDMEVYSFTFSMLFFFFSFLVLQLFAIFLVSAKKSFFKRQLLDTTWIGPKISCQKEYVLSAVFNSVVIFLLLIFFSSSTFLLYFFMLLFSVTIIPLFLNGIFAKRYFEEKRIVFQFKKLAIYCLCTFIVIVEILAIKMLDPKNCYYLLGYEMLVIFLGITIYFARHLFYKGGHWVKESIACKMVFRKWNYINSFALMALTRLVITSGLPIVFFYIGSYNYEQNLAVRFKHIDYAKRVMDKLPALTTDSIITFNKNWTGIYTDGNVVSQLAAINNLKAELDPGKLTYSKEDAYTIGLLNLFRLKLSDYATKEDKFYSPGSTDQPFFFNQLLKEACLKGSGTITYRQLAKAQQYLRIQSGNLNYNYPSMFKSNQLNGAFFWLLLAGSLVMFYFIIYTIIRKLFSLNLPEIDVWNQLDSEILVNRNWDQPLLVIGLPGAGKKKYLLDKIYNREITMDDGTPFYYNHPDPEKNNVFIAELINIPSTGNEEAERIIWEEYTKLIFNDRNRMIIVNHFEYNIQDALSNRLKLEFLERLFLENKCKIIILSTIHPVAFLDSALDRLSKPEDQLNWLQQLERWHVLLGHYRIVILPMQLRSDYLIDMPLIGNIVSKNTGNAIADVKLIIKDSKVKAYTSAEGQFLLPAASMPFVLLISHEGFISKELSISSTDDLENIELEQGPSFRSAQLLRQETNHSYFLKKTQSPAFEAGKKLSEETRIAKFDELAFKLQVSSHYFYMYIWQSLTKEEKFLLYDLAEDNLVNAFDDYNLSMLIAKGVIVKPDGTLKLFNKGFRNFILTAIGNSEAMKIKSQIKDNGNWSTLKNPIQLVIVAILAFLLTSQEEAFAKLITYVAALGAGVPAVLKLFTLFDKSPEKTA